MASTIKPGLPSKPEQPPLDLEPAGDCVAVECCAFIQDNCVCSETSGCNLGDVLPTGLSRNLPERDVRLEDSALDVHNNCKGIKVGQMWSAQSAVCIDIHTCACRGICLPECMHNSVYIYADGEEFAQLCRLHADGCGFVLIGPDWFD